MSRLWLGLLGCGIDSRLLIRICCLLCSIIVRSWIWLLGLSIISSIACLWSMRRGISLCRCCLMLSLIMSSLSHLDWTKTYLLPRLPSCRRSGRDSSSSITKRCTMNCCSRYVQIWKERLLSFCWSFISITWSWRESHLRKSWDMVSYVWVRWIRNLSICYPILRKSLNMPDSLCWIVFWMLFRVICKIWRSIFKGFLMLVSSTLDWFLLMTDWWGFWKYSRGLITPILSLNFYSILSDSRLEFKLRLKSRKICFGYSIIKSIPTPLRESSVCLTLFLAKKEQRKGRSIE